MRSHIVLFAGGDQTLRFVPVDRHGDPNRITGATYGIVDLRRGTTDSDRTIVAAGTAAGLGAASTTLSAAAGPSQAYPDRLAVGSVASFVAGRTFIVEDADGERETFVLDRIDSSNLYLFARYPLRRDYASGATVRAVELEATFPEAEAADESDTVDSGGGPYQLTWSYSVGGEDYLVPEVVWVSRYTSQPLVTEQEVLLAHPPMASRIRGRFGVGDAIAVATQDFTADLEAAGVDVTYLRTTHSGLRACRAKALEYLFRWLGSEQDLTEADRWEKRYEATLANLTTGKSPQGTAKVSPSDDTAQAGTDAGYGMPIVVRS